MKYNVNLNSTNNVGQLIGGILAELLFAQKMTCRSLGQPIVSCVKLCWSSRLYLRSLPTFEEWSFRELPMLIFKPFILPGSFETFRCRGSSIILNSQSLSAALAALGLFESVLFNSRFHTSEWCQLRLCTKWQLSATLTVQNMKRKNSVSLTSGEI